ncbi:MAG: siphovirus Gp157 family protein [Dehalococcoidia bacterium]|nr:siphovirus Gp157 family protein [Dehalococcoidia bacterium]
MNSKLYELTNAFALVQECMNEAEDPQEWVDMLDQIGVSIEAKAENICKLIRVLEADSRSAAVEAKRLSELAASREASVKRLKTYLRDCMKTAGLKAINLVLFKSVRVQASPPSVRVLDEGVLHSDFWRVIPETAVVDNAKILAWYKTTGEVPAGVEINQGDYLRIY